MRSPSVFPATLFGVWNRNRNLMSTILLRLAAGAVLLPTLLAQTALRQPTPPSTTPSERVLVSERGPNHQLIEVVRSEPLEGGGEVFTTNSVVQLEAGLNYQDGKGEWVPSREEFVLENGWA